MGVVYGFDAENLRLEYNDIYDRELREVVG